MKEHQLEWHALGAPKRALGAKPNIAMLVVRELRFEQARGERAGWWAIWLLRQPMRELGENARRCATQPTPMNITITSVAAGSIGSDQLHWAQFYVTQWNKNKKHVQIKLVQGDTALVRNGVGTFGSRSAARGGMHALGQAVKVRDKAQQVAAKLLEAASQDLVLADGKFTVRGVPDRAVTWQQVAAAAKGSLSSHEDIKAGTGMLFPFGSHVATVEVDKDTGRVTILKYMSVDDAGFLINPLLVQGQVHGGLGQGIGQALWEEAAFDESGQLISSTLMDYSIPKADNLISFDNDHTRTHSPRTPLGVKGIGEAATIGSTPAIANAVMDALAPLGVTHVDLPLTPQKIWAAMRSARKR